MHRSHTCGELRENHEGNAVTLSGWVQRTRDLGGMTFLDLRDRYGLTQVVFDMESDPELCKRARVLGREYVVKIEGTVAERASKNPGMPTGDVEVYASAFEVLSKAQTPPFTIEEETDGGEDLRMRYRFLDLRRLPLQRKLKLRHQLARETRNYLDAQDFLEIETPYLIKSTPEGARDFVVPSRMYTGQFYALPQSPQTFKQLLMISGYDRYFQIVRCFRDEDLRADRQPEFTQIDCEMAFVEQEDVLQTFEGMIRHMFRAVKDTEVGEFERLDYATAIRDYGNDKPDTRFDMKFNYLDEVAKGKGFKVVDEAESVIAINAEGCAGYSRKQLDKLTDWVKRPQIGAKGLIYVKCLEDGTFKSSVDKFFSTEDFQEWADACNAKPGDMLLVLTGNTAVTQKQMSELRLHMGHELELCHPNDFKPLWVLDFPLLEWDEETGHYHAMHHPFTAPKDEDMDKLDTNPGAVRANAYDMVINGVEVGGGSIRIHNRERQAKMFEVLGFSDEEARAQFGFLLSAFEYGAPPHGGIAFGFDRLCALFGGVDVIRDFIAFPKNNAGRDVMIDAPAKLEEDQLDELHLKVIRDSDQ